ncbi:DUF5129 domain-containing protein [Corynebacterium hylobatis]|nr:DUF5129 domain-containing protein [Corynebacterium hylobatis]
MTASIQRLTRTRSLSACLLLGFLAAVGAFLPGILSPASAAVAAREVEVIDLAGELSATDEQLLLERTPGLELPGEVTDVAYILFAENDDNLNDTVREFGEDERSDLISAERDKWAPGALIVAVGLDPQKMGVYCGDDVCAAIGIYGEGRLDGILDRMETPLRNGNWAAGMLEGAAAAGDPTAVRESSEFPAWAGWAIGGGIGVLAVGGGTAAVVATRRSQVKKAREQFDEVQRDYGRVAQELQAIDVRAHSLTSPLANDALRRQWEEVKSGFLGLNETFDRLEGLRHESSDAEFRELQEPIATAHEQVTRMRTAEENIELLAGMEHGDAELRRRELTELHEDILEAGAGIEDAGLRERLSLLDARVLDLRSRLEAPGFMDEFADLVGDHRVLVAAAQQRLYEESGTEETSDEGRRAPRVWESGWRPAYGYGNYVPFAVVHTWHSSDQQAASASSSSATTGYSAGGFSGGGGSRGF